MIDLKGLTYTDGWRDCVEKIKEAVALGLSYQDAVDTADIAIKKLDEEVI